jgi:hypothetical protein
MDIPVRQILLKMEQEIGSALAKQDNDVRDHLIVIQSLCELVLHQGSDKQQTEVKLSPSYSLLNEPKKNIIDEEEANGDSLFDF